MSLSVKTFSGGRSSTSIQATVFGATGFLGRYVVSKLGQFGCRVIVPYRGDELYCRHLKVMGDLGQINFHNMSIRSLKDIEHSVSGSNVVINLLGKHFETRRWSFQDVNVSFPSALAEVCAEQGIDRFIHVSGLGASVESPSAWARSKALGEIGVKEALPSATIMRPATIFGDEDRILNRMVIMSRHLPFYPLVNGGQGKQQPVHVDDVATAIVEAVKNQTTAGKTYSLAGPKIYTMKELTDFVFEAVMDTNNCVSVPTSVGMAIGFGVEQLPNPFLTRDELRLQATDVVMGEAELGLGDLGITPGAMEDLAERYLFMYKKQSPFIDDKNYVRTPQ